MSNRKKQPERCSVEVKRPHATLTASMVKINGQLLPAVIAAGSTRNPESIKEPDYRLEVKHNPFKKNSKKRNHEKYAKAKKRFCV